MKTPTASALKYKHETAHPDSHFFDKKTMRFFGDTMSNYKIGRQIAVCKRYDGGTVDCWELKRRKPVKMVCRVPASLVSRPSSAYISTRLLTTASQHQLNGRS